MKGFGLPRYPRQGTRFVRLHLQDSGRQAYELNTVPGNRL